MTHALAVGPARPFTPGSLRISGPVLLALKPDGSGDTTARMAEWLARATDSPLQAIGVLEFEAPTVTALGAPMISEELVASERRDAEERLRQQLELLPARDTPTRLDMLEGSAARCITDVARDRGASLIVVGTGRHSVLGRFLYGERALEITRAAVGPVLVVPSAAKPPITHALIAVDFSQASMRAAVTALAVLGPGGHLTLAHVKRAVELGELDAGWWNDAYELRSREMLERFSEVLSAPAGVQLDTVLLRGEVVDTLLAYAADHEVDLIACGRLSHSLVERITVGSVSSAFVRRSTCCVLVTPERPYDADVEDASWMTGVLVSRSSDQWSQLLRALNQRNAGRRAQVTMEGDSPTGVESLQMGFLFFGADYDRESRQVSLILGDADARGSQVTHRIARVRRVEMTADHRGRDTSVQFDTPTSRCTLTFDDAA